MGSCPKCRGPFAGSMDADDVEVALECVSCNHVGRYYYHWPDELPKVILRHKSNGRRLGEKSRGKKKKKNPDGVLAGQLPFPWGIK